MSKRPEDTTYPSADKWKSMQELRLQHLLSYLSTNSPFYQELFKKHRIDISAITTLEDLQGLPTTGKDDLQLRNEDFLCAARNKIVEYMSTSGTAGKPVTIALTGNDLDRLAHNEYSSFLCADGSADEIYQLMLTLDRQFMAGIAYYSGIRKLGAGLIRLGPGLPSMHWETIRLLKPTAIVAVPSFILKLVQFAGQQRIDLNGCSVKKAICIGENIRNNDFSLNSLGKRIKDSWDLRLYSTYASTEMQTAFTECGEGKGGHLQPELLIVELLDENDRKVGPNTPGEITITTLGVEGMPLLRYKTGDICLYFDEPCSCGRTTWRLSPVIGRKNQMIKLKGTTLYPPAFFDVLNELEEVIDYVVELYPDENGLDAVALHILPSGKNEEGDRRIRAYLKAKLRVSPDIIYVSAEEMQKIQFPAAGRKAVRFIDRRS